VSGKVPGEAEKWDDVIRKITSVWTPEIAAEVLAAVTKLDLRATPEVGDVPTWDGSKFVPAASGGGSAPTEAQIVELTGGGVTRLHAHDADGAFTDTFGDGVLDATWTGSTNGDSTVTEAGGVLTLTTGSAGEDAAVTKGALDLGSVFAQIASIPADPTVRVLVRVRDADHSNDAQFVILNGVLTAVAYGDTEDELASAPFDPDAHAWLRITFTTGETLVWETSPDGATWTQFATASPERQTYLDAGGAFNQIGVAFRLGVENTGDPVIDSCAFASAGYALPTATRAEIAQALHGIGPTVTAGALDTLLTGLTLANNAVSDPTGGDTVDAEARTAIATLIDRLEAAGILLPAS
jgi:hypothetical protein